jgi:hypothetical protein
VCASLLACLYVLRITPMHQALTRQQMLCILLHPSSATPEMQMLHRSRLGQSQSPLRCAVPCVAPTHLWNLWPDIQHAIAPA